MIRLEYIPETDNNHWRASALSGDFSAMGDTALTATARLAETLACVIGEMRADGN